VLQHGEEQRVGTGPFAQLLNGEVPAVIVRGALSAPQCQQLLRRFAERSFYPASFLPLLDIDEGERAALLAAAEGRDAPTGGEMAASGGRQGATDSGFRGLS
jgi:hypothetical protein